MTKVFFSTPMIYIWSYDLEYSHLTLGENKIQYSPSRKFSVTSISNFGKSLYSLLYFSAFTSLHQFLGESIYKGYRSIY